MRGILEIIARYRPEIIGLQELTPELTTLLEAPDQILLEEYQMVPTSVALLQPYWEAIYTRQNIGLKSGRIEYEHTQMGRGLTYLHCTKLDLVVGTTHLESMKFPTYRQAQFQEAMERLDAMNTRNAILMGDTNFRQGECQDSLPPGWIDVWETLYPHDPGWTREYSANAMVSSETQERLDRIYLRAQDFRPLHIERLGTSPLVLSAEEQMEWQAIAALSPTQVEEIPIFPSDHFGLLLTLEHKTT